jgi:hypothetical protein
VRSLLRHGAWPPLGSDNHFGERESGSWYRVVELACGFDSNECDDGIVEPGCRRMRNGGDGPCAHGVLEPAGAAGDHKAQRRIAEARGDAGGLRRPARLALVVEIEVVALRGTDRPYAEDRKTDAGSRRLGLGAIVADALG